MRAHDEATNDAASWLRLAQACAADTAHIAPHGPALSLFFTSGASQHAMASIASALRQRSTDLVVGGGSEHGIVGTAGELSRGLCVLRAHLECEPFLAHEASLPELEWGRLMHERPGGMLLLSAGNIDAEALARRLDFALPHTAKFGGALDLVYVNDTVYTDAAVGVLLKCRVDTIVSQGALPVGKPLIIDSVEPPCLVTSLNGMRDIGKAIRAAVSRQDVPDGAQLFIGVAVDQAATQFVVRQVGSISSKGLLVPVDPDILRPGTRLQFHAYGPLQAKAQLEQQLATYAETNSQGADAAIFATCVGRGPNLFGRANVESELLKSTALAPSAALAGFFANGELGPCDQRTYLHAYTSVCGLLRPRTD